MNNEKVFSAWAPDHSIWSPWVKPVLFSHLPERDTGGFELLPTDISWAPPRDERIALVLDLPGDAGVKLALALAKNGYRPVPLYNAIPVSGDAPGNEIRAAVDVVPIVRALSEGANLLVDLHLGSDAPPAFLLDANRQGPGEVAPDQFDNRSVSFTTDFPSANFLRAHGIQRAVLVSKRAAQPQDDLAHTLRKWQDGGIEIRVKGLLDHGGAEPIEIKRPPRFRSIFQRALASMGLRRNPMGGFGAWVPNPESHGGGG